MNVLIVTGIFPPDHGGPASYVPTIAQHFIRRGHRVTNVITLSDSLDHNDQVFVFPVKRLPRQISYLKRWLLTVWTIRKEAKKADVVYLNGLVFEGIVATKILSRRPAVIKVVGDLIWEKASNLKATTLSLDAFQTASLPFKWRALRSLQSWYTSLADAVITPSVYLASIVKDGWGVAKNRVHTVYNAVSIPAPPRGGEAPTYDLVTVARLVPWKGLTHLIDVVAENDWSLRIVGDGPMREELERRAEERGAYVSFAGQVSKAEVPGEIRKGYIFVLYSDYEGLPHIVLEAKAAGVAVLASAAGGTPETIKHGVDGWLVPPGDPKALAQAINQILSDEALHDTLVVEGQRSISEKFCLDAMVSQTLSVLQKVSS